MSKIFNFVNELTLAFPSFLSDFKKKFHSTNIWIGFLIDMENFLVLVYIPTSQLSNKYPHFLFYVMFFQISGVGYIYIKSLKFDKRYIYLEVLRVGFSGFEMVASIEKMEQNVCLMVPIAQ